MKRTIGVLVASALLIGAVGCSATPEASNLTASDVGTTPPVAGQPTEGSLSGITLTFAGYGGDPQQVQMDILEGFSEITGAKILSDAPADPPKIKTQVDTNNVSWDVVTVDSVWASANCDLLMAPDLEIIDTSQLPEGIEVGECGVPGDITGDVFAYDKDAFATEKPSSWADFFDTTKFPGKRAVDGNSPVVVYEIALLADGVSAEELYPLDVDRALAKLETIKDDLVFWGSGADQQQMIESGQVQMGYFWSGRVRQALANGSDWGLVHDSPLATITYMAVPNGAKNPAASMALINYWMGEEQSAEFTEGTSYPGPNRNAAPQLDDYAKLVQVTEAPFRNLISVDSDYWAQNIADQTDRWVNWMNG